MTYTKNFVTTKTEAENILKLLSILDFTDIHEDGDMDKPIKEEFRNIGAKRDDFRSILSVTFEDGMTIDAYLYSGDENYYMDIAFAPTPSSDPEWLGPVKNDLEDIEVEYNDNIYRVHWEIED